MYPLPEHLGNMPVPLTGEQEHIYYEEQHQVSQSSSILIRIKHFIALLNENHPLNEFLISICKNNINWIPLYLFIYFKSGLDLERGPPSFVKTSG